MQQLSFNQRWLPISLLLSILLTLTACSSGKEVQNGAGGIHATLVEQLNNCKDNQERLHKLMQGTYIRYVYPDNDSLPMRKWVGKNGQDSMFIHVNAIGDPAKEGYFLLLSMFSTGLLEEPYYNSIFKIEKIDRDTLVVLTCSSPNSYTLQEVLDNKVEEEIDLKKLISESGKPYYLCTKESNTKFSFKVARRDYMYGGDNADIATFESVGHMSLKGRKITWLFYNKEDELTSKRSAYEIRRYNMNLKSMLKQSQ